MIAITKSPRPTANAQHDEQFLKMVPAIQRYARSAFRNLRAQNRKKPSPLWWPMRSSLFAVWSSWASKTLPTRRRWPGLL